MATKNSAIISAALRSKHIRTLEVLQTMVDENQALKAELSKQKNNNSDVDRLAVAAADATKKQLASAEQTIAELRVRLAASSKNKAMEEHCRQLQEKVERQEIKLKTYENGKQELLGSIGKKDAEIASAMAQAREAVAGKKEAEEAADRLRQEIQALNLTASGATERESALQKANADLEQQLEAMRQSLASSADKTQIETLMRQRDEYQALAANLRTANQNLTKDIQTAKQSMKVLQEVHESTVASKDALETELLNIRTQQVSLEEENRQLVEALNKLRAKMDKIHQEQAAAQSGSRFGNFVALKKENEQLQKKLTQYKTKLKQKVRR